MGRIDAAMRRAQQSGVATEFDPIPATVDDMAVLAAEPFPAEAAVWAPAPVEAPKAAVRPQQNDSDLKELFFKTYPAGRDGTDALSHQMLALLRFLEKVRASGAATEATT